MLAVKRGRQGRANPLQGQTQHQHKANRSGGDGRCRQRHCKRIPGLAVAWLFLPVLSLSLPSGGASAQLSESLRAIGRMEYLVRNIFHVLSMSSTVQARPEMSLLCNIIIMLQKQASQPVDLDGYRWPLWPLFLFSLCLFASLLPLFLSLRLQLKPPACSKRPSSSSSSR